MISYREFIDTQERSYMTEDEILAKKNSEIITFYKTAGNSIYNQVIPEKIAPKTNNANVRLERNKNRRYY